MKGADAIARILKQEGVDFIGIIPMNALEEAAAKNEVRPIIFRQERVGVPQDVVPAIQWAQRVVASGRPALLEVITKEELAFPFRSAV